MTWDKPKQALVAKMEFYVGRCFITGQPCGEPTENIDCSCAMCQFYDSVASVKGARADPPEIACLRRTPRRMITISFSDSALVPLVRVFCQEQIAGGCEGATFITEYKEHGNTNWVFTVHRDDGVPA